MTSSPDTLSIQDSRSGYRSEARKHKWSYWTKNNHYICTPTSLKMEEGDIPAYKEKSIIHQAHPIVWWQIWTETVNLIAYVRFKNVQPLKVQLKQPWTKYGECGNLLPSVTA